MNIFFLDKNPKLAAEYQCNKHVVKMVVESAQLLSTAHRVLTESCPEFLYKATHKNHPCGIWVRTAPANYIWLATHALALCKEYSYRYGKTHKSQPIIEWCLDNVPFEECGYLVTENLDSYFPPQCMPEECQIEGDIVGAYRNFYKNVKMKTIKCEWKKREVPKWIQQ